MSTKQVSIKASKVGLPKLFGHHSSAQCEASSGIPLQVARRGRSRMRSARESNRSSRQSGDSCGSSTRLTRMSPQFVWLATCGRTSIGHRRNTPGRCDAWWTRHHPILKQGLCLLPLSLSLQIFPISACLGSELHSLLQ